MHELGTKGAGEGGTIGGTAALANAIADALSLHDVTLPLSPDRNYMSTLEMAPGSTEPAAVGSAFGNPSGSLANFVPLISCLLRILTPIAHVFINRFPMVTGRLASSVAACPPRRGGLSECRAPR